MNPKWKAQYLSFEPTQNLWHQNKLLQHLQFPLIASVKQRNCVDVSLPKIDPTVQACWGFHSFDLCWETTEGVLLKLPFWGVSNEYFLFSCLFAAVSNKITPKQNNIWVGVSVQGKGGAMQIVIYIFLNFQNIRRKQETAKIKAVLSKMP